MTHEFPNGKFTATLCDTTNCTVQFASNDSPITYHLIMDVNDIYELNPIFECDFELFEDMICDKPNIELSADCCIATYELANWQANSHHNNSITKKRI